MTTSDIDWAFINDGTTFERLIQDWVWSNDPGAKVFRRSGRDCGIDALSEDSQIVYQAKYHQGYAGPSQPISDAEDELDKIEKYLQPDHECSALWESVDTWILCTNVAKNPQTTISRWKNEIEPKFKSRVGLDAKLIAQGDIEQELQKFSHLVDVYFGGRNFVFWTLKQIKQRLTDDVLHAFAFEYSSYISRCNELASISNFIDSQKQILPIKGQLGTGKTRLLYEFGNNLNFDGNVLWLNEDEFSNADRPYISLPDESRVILLVDSPQSPETVRRLYNQVTTSGRRSNWNVIITVNSTNQPVLKELKAPRRSSVSDPLVVPPLSEENGHNLACELLESGLDVAHREQSDMASELARAADDFPLWIVMAVKLLADGEPFTEFSAGRFHIADRYLQKFLEEAGDQTSNPRRFKMLLRWTALFQPVSTADDEILEFLVNETGYESKAAIIETYQDLEARRFAVAKGNQAKEVSITPNVMRQYILRDWLVSNEEGWYNSGARRLTERLVEATEDEQIPHPETVVDTLATLEWFEKVADRDVELLDEFVSQLKEDAQTKDLRKQLSIFDLISRIYFARIEDTVDIFRNIRENSTSSVDSESHLFPHQRVTHKDLVKKFPKKLGQASRFAFTQDEREAILKELLSLLEWEYERDIDWDRSAVTSSTADVLPRVLTARRHLAPSYTQEAAPLAHSLIEYLKVNPALKDTKLRVTEVFLEPLLQIQRERMRATEEEVEIKFILIPPREDSPEFQLLTELLERICDLIEDRSLPSPIHELAWRLLSTAKDGINRAARSRDGTWSDEFAEAGWQREVQILGYLSWTKQSLEKFELTWPELRQAREIWSWYIEYGENANSLLLDIAQECEELYLRKGRARELEPLFDRRSLDEQRAKQEDRGRDLAERKSSDEIRRFVEAAAHLKGPGRISALGTVATTLADKAGDQDFVFKYIEHGLGSEEEPHFVFASRIAQQKAFRIRESLNAPDDTEKADVDVESLSSELEELLCLYWDQLKPNNITKFFERMYYSGFLHPTNVDVTFVKDKLQSYLEDQKEYPLLHGIIGSLYFVDGDWFTRTVKELFQDTPPGIRSTCASELIDSMATAKGLNTQPNNPLNWEWVEWLVEIIVTYVPDLDNIPRGVTWYFDQTLKNTSHRFDVGTLNELIQNRIDLANQADEHDWEVAVSTIPTFSFSLTDFVRPLDEKQAEVPEKREAIERLLDYADSEVVGFFLPEYAVEIDPNGLLVPEYIAQRIRDLPPDASLSRIRPWSRFVGFYDEKGNSWRTIVEAVCEYATSDMTEIQPERVYKTLYDPRPRVTTEWVDPAAEDSTPNWDQIIAEYEKRVRNEDNPHIKSFRRWELMLAKRERQRYREDKDG